MNTENNHLDNLGVSPKSGADKKFASYQALDQGHSEMKRYIVKQNEYNYKFNPSNVSEKGSNIEGSGKKNNKNKEDKNLFLADKTSLQS